MSSTRLPGKVLKQVKGKTLLSHHIERLQAAKACIVVATTDKKIDDAIEKECLRLETSLFRGNEEDVLSRYYETARLYDFDVIVRVTSDCPLIDGELIQEGVGEFLKLSSRSYFSNCQRRTYPRGFDFEIFSFDLLEEAFFKAQELHEREHVTPYFYKKRDDISVIDKILEIDKSNYRLTVDTPEDFELIKILIEEGAADMNYKQIIKLLDKHPSWSAMNAMIEQKKLLP